MVSKYIAVGLLLLTVLVPPRSAAAFSLYKSSDGKWSVRAAGYVKTLALGLVDRIVPGTPETPGEIPLPETENTAQDFTRARLMLDGDIGEYLTWTVHYEHYALINPVREATTGFFAGRRSSSRDDSSLLGLDWTVRESGSLLWRNELDRLNVRFALPMADVVIGRQAISWGVGRFWTPSDLFVAFSPTEIDQEFKTGVDAATIKIPLGASAQIETVYAAFDEDFRRQSVGVRGQRTIGNFDLGVMGGKFFHDFVTGPFFDGEIRGIGVRGEFTFTHNTDSDSAERRTFFRGVTSVDYRFANSLYLLGEYYYNGFGAEDPEDYTRRLASERFARNEVFNVGLHYLGGTLGYEVHPLVNTSLTGLWNLTDQSALIGPLVVVSLSDEADLRAGAYLPIGTGFVGRQVQTEYGLYPQVYYLQLRLYF